MSALEKSTPITSNETSEPAEQAGIFLKGHWRQQLFDKDGMLVEGAIQNIHKAIMNLGKQGIEFTQRYEGYVTAEAPVKVLDEKRKPTGEINWVDGQLPGPDGVECVIYTRHLQF